MKKIILTLMIWLALTHQSFAAIAIDGSATGTAGCTTATTCAVTLTTSSTNDIIILWATSAGATSPVQSVSDTAGLTWALRKQYAGTLIGIEEWYAKSSGALTGDIITVTFTGTYGAARSTAFGVSGANFSTPFDTNGSVPALASNASSATESATISTDNANDMLIAGLRANSAFSTLTRASGFSQILATGTVNDFSNDIVSATQSSVMETFSWTGTAAENALIIDAIQQAGGAAPSNMLLDSAF